jgi:hypothetical protein
LLFRLNHVLKKYSQKEKTGPAVSYIEADRQRVPRAGRKNFVFMFRLQVQGPASEENPVPEAERTSDRHQRPDAGVAVSLEVVITAK